MIDWQELEKKYYMQLFKRTPATLVRGEGAKVWDDKGNEYLDFVAGWAVNSLGHCDPVQVQALTEQASATYLMFNNCYADYAPKNAKQMLSLFDASVYEEDSDSEEVTPP